MHKILKQIKITFATMDDLKKIYQLELKCFEYDILSLSDYERYIMGPTKLFVAKYNQQILASAILFIRKNSTSCRLYSFAVDPNYRRVGVGRKLFKSIESYLVKMHYKRLNLEVDKSNLKAIQFYKSHGFVTFSSYKNFYENGADAFRMRKDYA